MPRGSQGSGNGSRISQSNPINSTPYGANVVIQPNQTVPFDMSRQANPELANTVYNQQLNQRLKQQSTTPPPVEEEGGILTNLAKGSAVALEGLAKIPRFIYSAAAAPQNFIADTFDIPSLKATYDGFLANTNPNTAVMRQSPLSMLDELGDYYREQGVELGKKTKKYDDGIVESIGKGEFKKAGEQILDQIVETIPSIAVMAMTSGAGNMSNAGQVTKTVANALPFMSQRGAELQYDTAVPEWLKPVNAGLNGLAEVVMDQKFGTQAAIQGIVNRFSGEGRESAVSAAKDLVTSYMNKAINGGAKYVKPFVSGAVEEASTQMAQNLVDKFTVNPDIDVMEGVADAAIVGSAMTGSISTVGNIIQPKAKSRLKELETAQKEALTAVNNPEVSEQAKEGLNAVLEANNQEIEAIQKEESALISKLSPEQKSQAEGLSSQIDQLDAVINDPAVPEEVKKSVETQRKNVETELVDVLTAVPNETVEATIVTEPIQTTTEAQEVVTEPEIKSNEEYTTNSELQAYDDLADNLYNDIQNHKMEIMRAELSDKYNIPTYDQIYDEVKAERAAGKGFIGKIKQQLNDPFGQKQETDRRYRNNLEEAINNYNKEAISDAVYNDFVDNGNVSDDILFKIADKVKNKEDLSDRENAIFTNKTSRINSIIANENTSIKQEDVVEKPVPAKESIPTQSVEEAEDEAPAILKKAEDDLSALKQVTNKVQKYQASIKRLNEALRSGKITEQQFNETKVRFDDVIADSSPNVPKITNLTKEETSQLDNELKNENLTTNDFIEYERARAIEDVSNVPEAVQQSEVNDGGASGETQTSETIQEQKIGGQNAVQEQGTGEVLQRQPEETGKRGGERVGVEQSEQREEATKQSKKEEIAKIQERRQSIKDRISQKIKDQRGNLSSGFDPSLLKDFVELGATYVEEGIVNTKDFIKRFREDAKELGFDDSSITDEDIENDILKPNQPVQSTPKNIKKLDRLAHQNLEGAEIGSTASNQAREKKRGLTEDERQYQKQTRIDKLNHGADIIAEAVNTFGDDYVNGLLDYVQENASSISPDMRQTIYVSLENDLNRRLLEDPENLTLKKQEKLVADISRDYGRELARGVATGIFRQLGRNGYDLTDVTSDFFSPTELQQRDKIEKAVQATSEDVTQEAIKQEQGDIVAPTGEKLAKARAEVKKAKEEFSAFLKKSRGNLSSGANIGDFVAQAAKLMKAYAKLGIVKIEDVLSELRNDYGDDFVQDNIESLSQAFNSIQNNKEKVKKTLIDAGYGREINVNTKEGKQKRQVLDWRKLTGAEGSLDNINAVLDLVLPDKGYSKKEIEDSKQALKDEYNDLHASIIEKAINELNRRNTPKEGSNKILARRLADLYNYGLFEKENGEYDYLVNQTLGVTVKDQKLFDELKTLHKALAQVVSHRDQKGRMMSDVALSTAESTIKNMIKSVVEKVAFRDGNGVYKASVIAKNAMNVMQRVLLNTLNQLIENPYSAFVNASINKIQDALKKEQWDTKDLANHRKMLGKTVFENITTSRGDEYGGVGSAFTIKNSIDDLMRRISPNVIYQAAYSALTGRMFLDSSDSAFKIKRTEAEFTHNLIRVLTDKTNPNRMSQQEALKYVSEQLTGQSFEQAKVLAKDLITSINTGAGKEILIDTESNINRIANDIVKDNLVNGEAISREMVEASFKAGYTTAGHGLGHESNNFITRGLQALNRSIDSDLQDAVKRKEFGRAAMLNMYSILSRNMINPFVGGAANWTVIGLQKMGLPVQYLDDKARKNTAIDLSTVQGLRDLERSLEARATTARANGRVIVGGTVGLTLMAALFASGQDDELDEFLRSHPTVAKYFGKVVTPLVTLALAIKYDDEYDETAKKVMEVLGDRGSVYSEKAKLLKSIKQMSNDDTEAGLGKLGELVGNKFNFPFASAPMRYQVDALDRELLGKPQRPYREPSMGFWEGFFRRGWVDLFTPIEDE